MKIIKYFFEFVSILSLLCIFKLIGFKNASDLGSLIGKYIGPFLRSKNLVKKNLKIGLGKLEKTHEAEIINDMWSNFGRNLAEYTYLKELKNGKTGFHHMKINGLDQLDKIKKNNKPVIFYSGHFANFELMPMELYKYGIKLAIIYRPLNNLFLNPILEYARMKYVCPIQITKGRAGTRDLIDKLKDGYSIAMLVDQRVSFKEGPKIPLFEQPAYTTTIPAQLALKYNCKLVPLFIERKNGINFELTVHEPLEIKKTGNNNQDKIEITLKINQSLEKMIKKNPKQWLWSHNRWKQ